MTRVLAVLTAGMLMAGNVYSAAIPVRADSADEAGTEQNVETSETPDDSQEYSGSSDDGGAAEDTSSKAYDEGRKLLLHFFLYVYQRGAIACTAV